MCKGTGRYLCANGITMRCNRSAYPCRHCGWPGITNEQLEAEEAKLMEWQKTKNPPCNEGC